MLWYHDESDRWISSGPKACFAVMFEKLIPYIIEREKHKPERGKFSKKNQWNQNIAWISLQL